MSRTKRNNSSDSEGLRFTTPYKRKKASRLLRQFESSYAASNRDPSIDLYDI